MVVRCDDTADTVMLRKMVMRMNKAVMGGTDLKRAGVFDGLQPLEWRRTWGQKLAELGIVIINVRSNGFSIEKKLAPASEEDCMCLHYLR